MRSKLERWDVGEDGCYPFSCGDWCADEDVTMLEAEHNLYREALMVYAAMNYPHNEVAKQALYGRKLTRREALDCAALADDPRCRACGTPWDDHRERCEQGPSK